MHQNSTTTPQVNKVRIAFTKRKMTAYGGFALLAAFFERIGLGRDDRESHTDHGMFPERHGGIRKD